MVSYYVITSRALLIFQEAWYVSKNLEIKIKSWASHFEMAYTIYLKLKYIKKRNNSYSYCFGCDGHFIVWHVCLSEICQS